MATLTGISISPATVAKGSKAAVTPAISNPDRVSTIHGVDETGAPVTATYDVHEDLSLQVVQFSQLPAQAPPGTIVFATDSSSDTLGVDPANPLALVLQT